MAKAKPAIDVTQPPVSAEAAAGPVTDIISAPKEADADTTLPATGVGAPAEAVGDVTSTAAEASPVADFETSLRKEQTVVVKGPLQGRWRVGRHFTIEPTSIPLGELTQAEIEALCGDLMLTVAVVDAPY